MTSEEIIKRLLEKNHEAALLFIIDGLDDEERLRIRKHVWSIDPAAPMPRNLSYNYTTQKWIE